MSEYGHAEDPYTDPQTGVLRNLLGITEHDRLVWAETELTDAKLTWLADNPIPGAYDLRHLQAFHRTVFGDIEDWLRRLAAAEFVRRLAHYLGEVNALHPFREGNGRMQRAFFDQLAGEAGWRLRWSRVDSS